jgi:two-component system response regulator AdeR
MTSEEHTTGPRILIIEDEPEIAEIIEMYLRRDGFRTQHAGDAQQGMEYFHQQHPALVLLDIHLPGQNGIDILQSIRRDSETPVIMLTALTDDINKLLSLRLGADDYIAKPFNPAELIARVRTVLRRTTAVAKPVESSLLQVGRLIIDHEAHVIFLADDSGGKTPLPMTLTEFRLIAFMARQPKRCFSRFDLIDACLPESDALDRVIDSHLSKLRRKLQDAGCDGLIETVRGVGYRLWPDR